MAEGGRWWYLCVVLVVGVGLQCLDRVLGLQHRLMRRSTIHQGQRDRERQGDKQNKQLYDMVVVVVLLLTTPMSCEVMGMVVLPQWKEGRWLACSLRDDASTASSLSTRP